MLHTAWSCPSRKTIKASSSLASHLSVEFFAKMHSAEGACAPDVSWFARSDKNQTMMWLPEDPSREGIMKNLLELSTPARTGHMTTQEARTWVFLS